MLLGNQTAPVDDTTMVIYRGSRKPIFPERKRDLAKRCGINFIRLVFKESLSTTVGVSGFQHVKLQTQPRKGGGIEPIAQWHQNIYTLKAMAEGSMDFVPDEMGTGHAYLPDSPFNRVQLAYAEIAQNALWTIDDKDIHREICELANEIRESIQFKMEMEALKQKQTEVEMRVKEKNVVTGIEHKKKIEIEVEVLEDRVKEMELINKRENLKNRLVQLQGNLSELSIPEPVESPLKSEEKPEDNFEDIAFDINEQSLFDEKEISEEQVQANNIKKQARTEVHNNNRELIDSIRKKYFEKTGRNRGWAFSPEYRDKVGPLISARIQELKNEHATVGVAD